MSSEQKNQSDATELRALVPAEFNSRCSKCGLWKRLLPWLYVDSGGFWGSMCDQCAAPILANLLRRKLPSPFLESQFVDAVCSFGVNRKEAQLMLDDFKKERSILETPAGLFWHEESSEAVEPLGVAIKLKPRSRRKFRRKTAEEIFRQCVKLSREIRSRTEFFRSRRPDEPIREPADQGER